MDVKNFGSQVRKIRNGKGITQDELSDIADVSISQLGRIERGEINTGLSTVFSLARALEVSPHKLFHNGEHLDGSENEGVQLLMDAVTSMAASDYQFITPLIETDAPLKTLALIIKKLSEEVKENTISKNILEHVLGIANMGYWEYSLNENNVFWCNNNFKLFGLEKESNTISLEAAMETVKDIDKERVLEQINYLLNTKGPVDYVYTGLHANGQELDIVVNARLITSKSSGDKKVIGISTVLNGANQIEETVKSEVDNLKAMKQQMNKIVTSIKEDIQLPMQSIQSVLALLEKDSDLKKNDALKRKLDYIQDACNSVSTYIQNLHNLTK